MSKIKIHDLSPASADLPVVSLTGKELSEVRGGGRFLDWLSDLWEGIEGNWWV